jgi:multiple sugar transport system permease protein
VTTTVTAPPDAQHKAKNVTSDRSRAENRLGQKLVMPAIVMMIIVTAFPLLRAIWLSVYDYSLAAPDDRELVWFQNYVTALTDPLFWQTTGITVAYMVITVAVELVIGFAFAMVMHKLIFARGVVRTSILIPYGIITVVSGFSWQFAFSATNGFVNGWIPGIEDSFNWFGDTVPAVIAICISEIWKTTPFMSLLLLAGLAQVSEDMIEAAQVDGATWWQRLWKVILPNMRAAIMVAVLFRALDAYRIFDNIFVMTNGAEDTASISFLTYRQTIEQLQLGMGSALSVLLFVSVLLLAWLIIKLFRVDLSEARHER